MLHFIAFLAIGLVLGFLLASNPRQNKLWAIIFGIVGAEVAGFLFRSGLGAATATGKYGSLIVAIIVGAILAWIGRGIGAKS